MTDELIVAYSLIAERGLLLKKSLKEKVSEGTIEKLLRKSLIVEQEDLVIPAFSLEELIAIVNELINKINVIMEEIKDDSKSILDKLNEIESSIKLFVDDARKKASEGISKSIIDLNEKIEDIRKTINDFSLLSLSGLEETINLLDGLKNAIEDSFENLKKGLNEDLSRLKSSIIDDLKNIEEAIILCPDEIFKEATDYIKEQISDAILKIREGLERLSSEQIVAMDKIREDVANTFKQVEESVKALTAKLSERRDLLEERLEGIIEELLEEVGEAIEKLSNIFHERIEALKQEIFGSLNNVNNKIGVLINSINEEMKTLESNINSSLIKLKEERLKEVGTHLKELESRIEGNISSLTENLLLNVSNIRAETMKIFSTITGEVDRISKELRTLYSTLLRTSLNQIIEKMNLASDNFVRLLSRYERGVLSSVKNVESIAKQSQERLISSISDFLTDIEERIEGLRTLLSETLTTTFDEVGKKVTEEAKSKNEETILLFKDYSDKLIKTAIKGLDNVFSDLISTMTFDINASRRKIGSLLTLLDSGKVDIETIKQQLEDISRSLQVVSERASETFNEGKQMIINDLTTIFQKMIDTSSNIFNSSINRSIDYISSRYKEAIADLIAKIDYELSWFKESTSSLNEIVSRRIEFLLGGINKYISESVSALENVRKDVREGINKLIDELSKYLEKTFNTTLSKVNTLVDSKAKEFEKVVSNVRESIGEILVRTEEDIKNSSDLAINDINKCLLQITEHYERFMDEAISDVLLITKEAFERVSKEAEKSIKAAKEVVMENRSKIGEFIEMWLSEAEDFTKNVEESSKRAQDKLKESTLRMVEEGISMFIEDVKNVVISYHEKINEEIKNLSESLEMSRNEFLSSISEKLDVNSIIDGFNKRVESGKTVFKDKIKEELNKVSSETLNAINEILTATEESANSVSDRLIKTIDSVDKKLSEISSSLNSSKDELSEKLNDVSSYLPDIERNLNELLIGSTTRILEETSRKLIAFREEINRIFKKVISSGVDQTQIGKRVESISSIFNFFMEYYLRSSNVVAVIFGRENVMDNLSDIIEDADEYLIITLPKEIYPKEIEDLIRKSKAKIIEIITDTELNISIPNARIRRGNPTLLVAYNDKNRGILVMKQKEMVGLLLRRKSADMLPLIVTSAHEVV